MSTDDVIRASDADREHAVGILRDGYACGRLTLAEFDERTTAAFTSRTWGELRELTRDLPTAGQRGFQPPAPRQSRESDERLPAVPAGDGPGLVPIMLIALYWLALTFTAHAAGALIPAVLFLLMTVQLAGRIRCGLGGTGRRPPGRSRPPGGGPHPPGGGPHPPGRTG